jgi:hypothetical protein
MATVEGIRERLKDAFTAQQADVLAHVVVEAHADYVTRGDFHALTSVVKELAAAQQRTEARMEELAEAQLELAEAQKEFTWAMKDTRNQLGGLAQSVGYGLEAYAMERIPKVLAKEMPFVEESSGPEEFFQPVGGEDAIDVVVRGRLAGRPVAFLCEVKTSISAQEVRDFLPTAGRVGPLVGCDDVRTLFFCYRAGPEARTAVTEAGAYLASPHRLLVRPAESV